MPHKFTASFHSFILPILMLILIQIFAFALVVHPMKVHRDEQRQRLKNEDLMTAELAKLEKQIEKINSTIFAFFVQQEQRQPIDGEFNPADSNAQQREEMELDKAKLKRLKMEKELLEEMMENDFRNGTKASNNETMNSEIKKANPSSSSSSMVSDASRLLCQFFVFGILFGVVCSISACSCLFRSRRNAVGSSNQNCSQSVEEANFNRLSQIREPFAPDKPYCLKFDERGLCYASPLTREVPPLPNYEQACRMPTAAEIAAIEHSKVATTMGGEMATINSLQRATTVRKTLDSIDALRV